MPILPVPVTAAVVILIALAPVPVFCTEMPDPPLTAPPLASIVMLLSTPLVCAFIPLPGAAAGDSAKPGYADIAAGVSGSIGEDAVTHSARDSAGHIIAFNTDSDALNCDSAAT